MEEQYKGECVIGLMNTVGRCLTGPPDENFVAFLTDHLKEIQQLLIAESFRQKKSSTS